MGEISKTTMKKKKKKGRPSLLDLQKRFLKQEKLQEQHQQHQNPYIFNSGSNPRRPSFRRNRNGDQGIELISGEDDEDERIEKKHKLLLGLTSHQNYPTLSAYSFGNSAPNASDPNAYGEETEAPLKRCKIESFEVVEKGLKATDTAHGSQVESGPTTTLPDKKLLIFILDRLQKKDTHGVFSEPVDPEELPDYHDIIENPMDFGTVRAKLDGGAYTNMEEFEKDIFLICSNAMKYNAPDTVFFRQARSMQELAIKDFENLRQESDDSEPEQKVARRGRPPGKNQKRFLSSPLGCIGAEISPGVTLASQCDDSLNINGYNLRRERSYVRPLPGDPLVKTSTSQHGETLTSWLPEWKNEFPASVLKSVLKSGKNDNIAVDENRRDTYNNHSHSSSENWSSIVSTLDGELKQLLPVGLHAEHGYARSLALFAAGLGPVVWKIASKKFQRIGQELGSPWIQENEILQQQDSLSSVDKRSMAAENTCRFPCISTPGSNYGVLNKFSMHSQEAEISRERNSQAETISLDRSRCGMGNSPISSNIRGFNGDFGPQEMRMVRLDAIIGVSRSDDSSRHCTSLAGDMYSNQMSKLSEGSPAIAQVQESTKAPEPGLGRSALWQEMPSHHVLDSLSFNPNLNVGLGLSVPTSSNLQILSQIQPDLVLQL